MPADERLRTDVVCACAPGVLTVGREPIEGTLAAGVHTSTAGEIALARGACVFPCIPTRMQLAAAPRGRVQKQVVHDGIPAGFQLEHTKHFQSGISRSPRVRHVSTLAETSNSPKVIRLSSCRVKSECIDGQGGGVRCNRTQMSLKDRPTCHENRPFEDCASK